MSDVITMPEIVSPELKLKIDGAIARVPYDKRGAFEANVTMEGAEAYVGYRLRQNWTVGGWAGRSWTGSLNAGISLRGTF